MVDKEFASDMFTGPSTSLQAHQCFRLDSYPLSWRVSRLRQVPPDTARDKEFDLSMFTGRWYITAGLNQLFDTFPCQEHFFGVPEPGEC